MKMSEHLPLSVRVPIESDTLSRGETGVCLRITGEIGDIGARFSVLCSSEHILFS